MVVFKIIYYFQLPFSFSIRIKYHKSLVGSSSSVSCGVEVVTNWSVLKYCEFIFRELIKGQENGSLYFSKLKLLPA